MTGELSCHVTSCDTPSSHHDLTIYSNFHLLMEGLGGVFCMSHRNCVHVLFVHIKAVLYIGG